VIGVEGDPLHALAQAVGRMDATGRTVVACNLLVGLAVVVDLGPLRRHPPPGPARAASLLVTVAGWLVLGVPFAALLAITWGVWARLAPDALRQLWQDHPLLGFLACFVVVDAVAFVYHLVGHRTRLGWASHRVHHLGATYDMTLVLRQPWFPVHGLAVLPLTALAGFDLGVASACSALSIAYQALQHTNRTWGLGPLEVVLVSGRAHRHHHLVGGDDRNLGAVLCVWDRVLGTRHAGPVPVEGPFGAGEAEPLNPLGIQLQGWRRVIGGPPGTSQPARHEAAPLEEIRRDGHGRGENRRDENRSGRAAR